MKDRHEESSPEYGALQALERELLYRREESIRSQIRALAQGAIKPTDPGREEFSRRAVKIYNTQSRFVHEGFLTAEEFASAETEAVKCSRLFCGSL